MDKAKNFPVDAILTFKHSALRQLLQDLNWCQQDLADYLTKKTGINVSQAWVSSWIVLRSYPKNEAIMQELEILCGIPREELFPEFLKDRKFRKMIRSLEKRIEIDPDVAILTSSMEIISLPSAPDLEVIREEGDSLIDEALKTLSHREEEIIRLRFGFDSGKEKTLKEIAESFNISTDRVKIIEQKALKKLRHPSRSEKLRG